MNKSFWIAALKRCGHTVAQTAIGMIGTAVFVKDVDWIAVLSASALAGILSILKSLTIGVPEVQIEERKPPDEEPTITVRAYDEYYKDGSHKSKGGVTFPQAVDEPCEECDLTKYVEGGMNDD